MLRVGSGRRHQTPSKEMFEPLLKAAAAVGVEIEVGSSRQLADSLDKAVTKDPYFNKLIRILATRCMTQAQYICTGTPAPLALCCFPWCGHERAYHL